MADDAAGGNFPNPRPWQLVYGALVGSHIFEAALLAPGGLPSMGPPPVEGILGAAVAGGRSLTRLAIGRYETGLSFHAKTQQ